MLITRTAKIVMSLVLAAFCLLVAFDNITDYGTNYLFVQHVLSMDTTFPGNALMYRSITNPVLWQIAYAGIIAAEGVTGLLFLVGAIHMFQARHAPASEFNRAKAFTIAACLLAFLVWYFGFMVVGGEWFAMWQSQAWNGQEAAFRFYMAVLGVLIFVNMPDGDLPRGSPARAAPKRRRSGKAKAIRRPKMRAPVIALILAVLAVPATAAAEPTEITVRVLAKDSKFVGTSMGGMRIVLRDAQTGEILATGVTQGGTGDTALIMHEDRGSRAVLSDEGAAKFTATLDLDEPRLIEVDAYGPLAQPQSAARVLATQWVVPGRHLTGGDGFVLELPGLSVDVLAPPAHIRIPSETKAVDVRANVVMMCGCPIEPGGMWDADKLEVKAIVKRNGERISEVPLAFAGETSQFAAKVPVEAPGFYEVIVYAHDPRNGNTGLDRTTFIASGG